MKEIKAIFFLVFVWPGKINSQTNKRDENMPLLTIKYCEKRRRTHCGFIMMIVSLVLQIIQGYTHDLSLNGRELTDP